MLTAYEKAELKAYQDEYDDVCEKLDAWNEKAFGIEQEIWRLKAKEKGEMIKNV